MSAPPVFRALRLSDFAQDEARVLPSLLEAFNLFQREVIDCLSRGISRENTRGILREGLTFTSPASGDAQVSVFHGLPQPARFVQVNLAAADGAALSGPWSFTTTNQPNGQVLLTFQGLSASTRYNFAVSIE